MAQRVEHNPLQDALAALLDQGLDGADRLGSANGFKPKTMKTRMGELTFAVPQVREGGF